MERLSEDQVDRRGGNRREPTGAGCIGSDPSNPMEAVRLSPERHGGGLSSERPGNLEVLHSAGGFEEDVGAKDEAMRRGSASSPVFEDRTLVRTQLPGPTEGALPPDR